MNHSLFKKLQFQHAFLIVILFLRVIAFAQDYSPTELKTITLAEAIQLGNLNNRQLKIANVDIAIADQNVNQSKIAKIPRLSLSGGYTYIGDPKLYEGFYESNIKVDYYNHRSFANIVSTMPIYSGGIINSKIEQQKLITNMQQSVARMTQAEIKNLIKQYFFTLEKLYRQIDVT